ncbi:MAG: hypothetical protein WC712_03045 [Candidatus Brocadiia bacterium]
MRKLSLLALIILAAVSVTLIGCTEKSDVGNGTSVQSPDKDGSANAKAGCKCGGMKAEKPEGCKCKGDTKDADCKCSGDKKDGCKCGGTGGCRCSGDKGDKKDGCKGNCGGEGCKCKGQKADDKAKEPADNSAQSKGCGCGGMKSK